MAAPEIPADGVARFVVRLGDDAVVMGQRLCEWTSNGPTLEEDLALANVALDYLGRARMFYGYAGELLGCSEDDLAFLRDARQFENLLMVELPRGDFAFTMARQFLLDCFELRYFGALRGSADGTLSGFAERIEKEVRYHSRRSEQWLLRLGLGTAESHRRVTEALQELWGYRAELFEMDALEERLRDEGVAVDRSALVDPWHEAVTEHLERCGLQTPDTAWQVTGGRSGVHTESLGFLLAEMQSLPRAHPGLEW